MGRVPRFYTAIALVVLASGPQVAAETDSTRQVAGDLRLYAYDDLQLAPRHPTILAFPIHVVSDAGDIALAATDVPKQWTVWLPETIRTEVGQQVTVPVLTSISEAGAAGSSRSFNVTATDASSSATQSLKVAWPEVSIPSPADNVLGVHATETRFLGQPCPWCKDTATISTDLAPAGPAWARVPGSPSGSDVASWTMRMPHGGLDVGLAFDTASAITLHVTWKTPIAMDGYAFGRLYAPPTDCIEFPPGADPMCPLEEQPLVASFQDVPLAVGPGGTSVELEAFPLPSTLRAMPGRDLVLEASLAIPQPLHEVGPDAPFDVQMHAPGTFLDVPLVPYQGVGGSFFQESELVNVAVSEPNVTALVGAAVWRVGVDNPNEQPATLELGVMTNHGAGPTTSVTVAGGATRAVDVKAPVGSERETMVLVADVQGVPDVILVALSAIPAADTDVTTREAPWPALLVPLAVGVGLARRRAKSPI